MKPLYKPPSERVATRKALTRALDMLWQMYPMATDADEIEHEAGVVIVAHAFALTKRRLALAVSTIRAAEKKRLLRGEVNEHHTPEKKATTLLASSAYFLGS